VKPVSHAGCAMQIAGRNVWKLVRPAISDLHIFYLIASKSYQTDFRTFFVIAYKAMSCGGEDVCFLEVRSRNGILDRLSCKDYCGESYAKIIFSTKKGFVQDVSRKQLVFQI